MKHYTQLEERIAKIGRINNIINLLTWDTAVNMPNGSADNRIKDITTLTSMIRSILTSAKTVELVERASETADQLNNWQLANLREIKRELLHALSIEDSLQKQFISSTTQCELAWRQAKAENNYAKLKPYLQSVLNCVKEIAASKSQKLNCSNYDALVDTCDPNGNTADIKRIYAVLKEKLPHMIRKICDKQKGDAVLPLTEMSIEQQKLISHRIIATMGFDLNKGRLDESVHPFCLGNPDDVRLTTKYNKQDFLLGLLASIHEAGHGLYEQNLPQLYKEQFVGRARGMSLHESQSLFMERQIGNSREFIEFLSRLLRDEFNIRGEQYSDNNIYKLITQVQPSFIRIYADEVTYPMHVILRFEIEEALINDTLTLDELPLFWNQKMHEYLGITPSTYQEGCLQDIHWNKGSFGYFPSYTNGAIIASMLMKSINQSYPNISQEISQGYLKNVNQFLNHNIRNFGSLKERNHLIKDATGNEKLDPIVFLQYLENKYLM